MNHDRELFTLTLSATVFFAAIALFFGRLLRRVERASPTFKPPHRKLELVFRLWFAALALASLFLTFRSHR